jgi:hypothetical protein
MYNNWNEADAVRQVAAIHSYVVAALNAALLDWVWQGHEYVRSALPYRLDVAAAGQSPERALARWRVQAGTQFLDRDRAPLALIRLTWTRGDLDWESLLSSAWLIAHEFVCHAQRLPARDGSPRTPSGEDCPFYGGWMEEVAYALFSTRVVGSSYVGPDAMPPSPSPVVVTASDEGSEADDRLWVRAHLGEMARVATDFRRDRYGTGADGRRQPVPAGDSLANRSVGRPMGHLFAQQWELGAQAGRVLWRFLASCTSYELVEKRNRAALGQLVSLSFRIQSAAPSPDELRRVVNGCLLAGQTALSFMKNPDKARFLQLLTQPIPDIAVWSYKLEALCRTFPV